MEILAWAFLGGIVGAVLMDVTETYAAKVGISSGVNVALVGRWFLGLLRGQITHTNIRDSKPFPQEAKAGWAFHILVGGGGVALVYPLFFKATGLPLPSNHLLGGLLFGLAISITTLVRSFALFWLGFFWWRGPQGSNAMLASMLSHIPYGLRVGAVITVGLYV